MAVTGHFSLLFQETKREEMKSHLIGIIGHDHPDHLNDAIIHWRQAIVYLVTCEQYYFFIYNLILKYTLQ